jgi:hypothetical protein
MRELMGVWIKYGLINGFRNGWRNEWRNEWRKRWINGWIAERMGESMNMLIGGSGCCDVYDDRGDLYSCDKM